MVFLSILLSPPFVFIFLPIDGYKGTKPAMKKVIAVALANLRCLSQWYKFASAIMR
jgi:hypothetical protein